MWESRPQRVVCPGEPVSAYSAAPAKRYTWGRREGAPRTTAIRDFAAPVDAGGVRRGSGRGAYYVPSGGAPPP